MDTKTEFETIAARHNIEIPQDLLGGVVTTHAEMSGMARKLRVLRAADSEPGFIFAPLRFLASDE